MNKRFILTYILLFILIINSVKADGGLVAFYKLGSKKGSISTVENKINKILFLNNNIY